MTQDDVIKITRALGICELTSKPKQAIHYSLTIHEMLDAFKLVAAKERDRMCEQCKWSKYENATCNEANQSKILGEG